MSHSRYLAIIATAAIFSWIGFILVFLKLDPFETPGMRLALFFSTLFLSLLCSFSVIGYYLRLWLNRNEIYYQHINVSLRQAFLLSLLTIAALSFQLLGVLNWWTGILLLFSVLLIEFYFTIQN